MRYLLKAALKKHINSYKTSSVGRLFDIAAVIMNICQKNSYEGERLNEARSPCHKVF